MGTGADHTFALCKMATVPVPILGNAYCFFSSTVIATQKGAQPVSLLVVKSIVLIFLSGLAFSQVVRYSRIFFMLLVAPSFSPFQATLPCVGSGSSSPYHQSRTS